jgi:hypothetical protein
MQLPQETACCYIQADGGRMIAIDATLTVCTLAVLEVNLVKGLHGLNG